MIKDVELNGELYAKIIRPEYDKEGIQFFTNSGLSQQVGYMNRPSGYVIEPHLHLRHQRTVQDTNEVLMILKGVVRVSFYTEKKQRFAQELVRQGDVLLLIKGGHGFEVIEKANIIEVKQGPYAGDADKERFGYEE